MRDVTASTPATSSVCPAACRACVLCAVDQAFAFVVSLALASIVTVVLGHVVQLKGDCLVLILQVPFVIPVLIQ